jgi:nitroreductase
MFSTDSLSPLAAGARCDVSVLAAIDSRRSVRAYTERSVEPATIRALLDAATRAPSALNLQPWAFVVVQQRDLLSRFSARAKELSLAEARPGSPLWEHRDMLTDPAFDVFYAAGTLVVICATSHTSQASEDCCLAAQNFMLAAHALGLDTCPIGFARAALNEPLAKAELGIPDDHAVVMPIVVGYARARPAPTPRRPAHILHWS